MNKSPDQSVSVLSADQAGLVDQIKAYHTGFHRSYEQQIKYAFLCGRQFRELKNSCGHGNAKDCIGFTKLCEAYLPEVSRSARHRYMDFVDLLEEKFPAMGNIRVPNLLEQGELPERDKTQVLNAVHEVADGKTWTAFYRDLQLIRDKQPKQYHAPKPTSPDEQLAAAKKAADDAARTWLADTNLLMQGETWSLLSPDRQREIDDLRLDLGTFVKNNTPRKQKAKQ